MSRYFFEVVTEIGEYTGWLRLPGGYLASPFSDKTVLLPNKGWLDLKVESCVLAPAGAVVETLVDHEVPARLTPVEQRALAVGLNLLEGARLAKRRHEAQRALNALTQETEGLSERASEVLGELFLAAGLDPQIAAAITGMKVTTPTATYAEAPKLPDPYEVPPERVPAPGELRPCWDCGNMKPVAQQKNHSCIDCRAARELG